MANINQTPNANRIHISFFGNRNAGKSSIVNAVTNQDISIVSDVKGTTTDPVQKAMELFPIGPVLIIDTPGIDDDDETIGKKRIEKAQRVFNKTDVAVLVIDSLIGASKSDNQLIDSFKQHKIPYIIVYNKSDLKTIENLKKNEILVSAKNKTNIEELKEKIGKVAQTKENSRNIISDDIDKSDVVILVTPIDSSAPKGRLILPQVQTIRDILDANAICIVTQLEQLKKVLLLLNKAPKLVVTDSQVFSKVKDIVPREVYLTSFSILMARYKGMLKTVVDGAKSINKLNDGDTVLISEGCTHHRQCEDIGTVKMPKWISDYTQKKLNFEFSSGTQFPANIEKYSLIVHCGACMLNEREMIYRKETSEQKNIPFTNYGILIAYMNGILERSIDYFKEL